MLVQQIYKNKAASNSGLLMYCIKLKLQIR
jgi:hypothetical protein